MNSSEDVPSMLTSACVLSAMLAKALTLAGCVKENIESKKFFRDTESNMSLGGPALEEVHYCSLQSQSNVYGLAKLFLPHAQHKVLVASLGGKVMSLEFQKSTPSSKEVAFTYIPGRLATNPVLFVLLRKDGMANAILVKTLDCIDLRVLSYEYMVDLNAALVKRRDCIFVKHQPERRIQDPKTLLVHSSTRSSVSPVQGACYIKGPGATFPASVGISRIQPGAFCSTTYRLKRPAMTRTF